MAPVNRSGSPLTEAEVLAEIQQNAADRFGLARTITPLDELFTDLDLDSVELITLAVELEERFKIALPPEASARVRTVGDLCKMLACEADARSSSCVPRSTISPASGTRTDPRS